jgi:hypothetical protein
VPASAKTNPANTPEDEPEDSTKIDKTSRGSIFNCRQGVSFGLPLTEGTIGRRKDGRYEAKVFVRRSDGTYARRSVYGKTRAECDRISYEGLSPPLKPQRLTAHT